MPVRYLPPDSAILGECADGFQVLDPLALLPSNERRLRIEPGAVLRSAAYAFCLILEGFVLAPTVSRRCFGMSDIYGPEDLICGLAHSDEEALQKPLTVLTPGLIMHWSRAEIQEAIRSNPHLAYALWQTESRRVQKLGEDLQVFDDPHAGRRVAWCLIELYARFGEQQGSSIRLKGALLDRSLIARAANVAPSTAVSWISRLRREGFVRGYGPAIQLAYREELKEWATGSYKKPWTSWSSELPRLWW